MARAYALYPPEKHAEVLALPETLTAAEVGRITGVHSETVRRWRSEDRNGKEPGLDRAEALMKYLKDEAPEALLNGWLRSLRARLGILEPRVSEPDHTPDALPIVFSDELERRRDEIRLHRLTVEARQRERTVKEMANGNGATAAVAVVEAETEAPAKRCKCGRGTAGHKGLCSTCWSEITKRAAERRRLNRQARAAAPEPPSPRAPEPPSPRAPEEGADPRNPADLAVILHLVETPDVRRFLSLPLEVQDALRVLVRYRL